MNYKKKINTKIINSNGYGTFGQKKFAWPRQKQPLKRLADHFLLNRSAAKLHKRWVIAIIINSKAGGDRRARYLLYYAHPVPKTTNPPIWYSLWCLIFRFVAYLFLTESHRWIERRFCWIFGQSQLSTERSTPRVTSAKVSKGGGLNRPHLSSDRKRCTESAPKVDEIVQDETKLAQL